MINNKISLLNRDVGQYFFGDIKPFVHNDVYGY